MIDHIESFRRMHVYIEIKKLLSVIYQFDVFLIININRYTEWARILIAKQYGIWRETKAGLFQVGYGIVRTFITANF